jgi:NAD(P)H-dependent flavin oxidoreductase YrpB (nitropropane dioxygenase family)
MVETETPAGPVETATPADNTDDNLSPVSFTTPAETIETTGVALGTRFIATKEAPAHDNVKQALVAANELQTRLIMRPLRNTERVLTNATAEEILAIERDKGAATTIEDIRHLVGGAGNRRVLQDGELDAGACSCGMVAGLIHDIPTCKELIDRIMAEAEAIIRSRLEGLLAA